MRATIILRAPAAAGTATVSYYKIAAVTGIATLEGTLTITFTASSGLDVSDGELRRHDARAWLIVAPSMRPFRPPASRAPSSAALRRRSTPAAQLCILLRDGNGTAVDTAAGKVAATITPYGSSRRRPDHHDRDERRWYGVAASDPGERSRRRLDDRRDCDHRNGHDHVRPGELHVLGRTREDHPRQCHHRGPGRPPRDLSTRRSHSSARMPRGTGVDLAAASVHHHVLRRRSVHGRCRRPDSTRRRPRATWMRSAAPRPERGTVTVKSGTIVSNAVTFNCSMPPKTFAVAFSPTASLPVAVHDHRHRQGRGRAPGP